MTLKAEQARAAIRDAFAQSLIYGIGVARIPREVIETIRCPRCKVYHAASAAHECAPQIEAPK